MTIGLAGGYCTGKDTVARILAGRGFSVIDVDKVGHRILEECAPRVISAFGPGIRGEDGRIDRKALGRIVFADPEKLSLLESMVHPPMIERVKSLIQSAHGDVVVNAAILYKMGLDSLCQAVFRVTAPIALRVARAMRRDGIGFKDAILRVSAQRGIRPKSGASQVDTYYIRNWGTIRSLERSVQTAMERVSRGKAH
jgi:dephospho-CoA kinase